MDAHSWLPRSRKKFSGYLICSEAGRGGGWGWLDQLGGAGGRWGCRRRVSPTPSAAGTTACAHAAHFEREQQANGLQALLATVDIVPQEQVVGLGREACARGPADGARGWRVGCVRGQGQLSAAAHPRAPAERRACHAHPGPAQGPHTAAAAKLRPAGSLHVRLTTVLKQPQQVRVLPVDVA